MFSFLETFLLLSNADVNSPSFSLDNKYNINYRKVSRANSLRDAIRFWGAYESLLSYEELFKMVQRLKAHRKLLTKEEFSPMGDFSIMGEFGPMGNNVPMVRFTMTNYWNCMGRRIPLWLPWETGSSYGKLSASHGNAIMGIPLSSWVFWTGRESDSDRRRTRTSIKGKYENTGVRFAIRRTGRIVPIANAHPISH